MFNVHPALTQSTIPQHQKLEQNDKGQNIPFLFKSIKDEIKYIFKKFSVNFFIRLLIS